MLIAKLQLCNSTITFLFSGDGFLYDKEAIIEYILHKKKEISRMLKEYEKQRKRYDVCHELIGHN
jgi:hypothetical protein